MRYRNVAEINDFISCAILLFSEHAINRSITKLDIQQPTLHSHVECRVFPFWFSLNTAQNSTGCRTALS